MITINNYFEEESVDIFKENENGESTFVGTCRSSLSLNDLRIQIKREKVNGYFFIFKDNHYKIHSNGRIGPEYPFGLYKILSDQLDELTSW